MLTLNNPQAAQFAKDMDFEARYILLHTAGSETDKTAELYDAVVDADGDDVDKAAAKLSTILYGGAAAAAAEADAADEEESSSDDDSSDDGNDDDDDSDEAEEKEETASGDADMEDAEAKPEDSA